MSGSFDVRLTAGAEADLGAIHDWLRGERGADDADAWLDLLLERITALETFPLRGETVPELRPLGMSEFRQIIAAPYRIIYAVEAQTVVIMIIAHGRRNFRTLLEQRLLSRR